MCDWDFLGFFLFWGEGEVANAIDRTEIVEIGDDKDTPITVPRQVRS